VHHSPIGTMIATLSMMSALQIVGSLTTIRVVVQDEIPRVPMMFQRETICFDFDLAGSQLSLRQFPPLLDTIL